MRLPEDERKDLAAKLLDSLESPPGISIEAKEEIERRAAEARTGAHGVGWDELKRVVSVTNFPRHEWHGSASGSPELSSSDVIRIDGAPHAGCDRRVVGYFPVSAPSC